MWFVCSKMIYHGNATDLFRIHGWLLYASFPYSSVEAPIYWKDWRIKKNLNLINLLNTLQVFAFLAAEYETPKNALNQVCWSMKPSLHIVQLFVCALYASPKSQVLYMVPYPNKLDYPLTLDTGCQFFFEITFHWLIWMYCWQISLWDSIIPSREDAKFWIHSSNKYRFVDQVSDDDLLVGYLFLVWISRHLDGDPGYVTLRVVGKQFAGQGV